MAKAIDKIYLINNLKNFESKIIKPKYLETANLTVSKLETAEAGFAASYQVQVNGTKVGSTINIPKDFLVKSASVKTSTVETAEAVGVPEGKKYIDFVINAIDSSETAQHLYLPLDDLLNIEAGNGISVSGGTVSAKLATSSGLTSTAEGLSISVGNGLKKVDGSIAIELNGGSGISVNNNSISVNYGDGLKVDGSTNKVSVDVDSIIQFEDTDIDFNTEF